ncbi:MAG: copper chaperone PCu(A)C [Pseudomonadota bacterium]|nr:copper chaperone PCu(A)C [Pseudomonadota bacterium]
MVKLIFPLLFLFSLNGWAELIISDASINLSPMANIPSSGYMKILNKSPKKVSILDISSSKFEEIQWHETVVSADGIARMRLIKNPEIPAFGAVTLKRGGNHLMLYKASKKIESNSEIDLLFKLSSGQEQRFSVKAANPDISRHNH